MLACHRHHDASQAVRGLGKVIGRFQIEQCHANGCVGALSLSDSTPLEMAQLPPAIQQLTNPNSDQTTGASASLISPPRLDTIRLARVRPMPDPAPSSRRYSVVISLKADSGRVAGLCTRQHF